jgi:hypothetical protein
MVNVLPAFHPKPVFISVNKMGLVNNRLLDLPFSIQFAKWYLLMKELSSLTFSVNMC